MKGIVLGGHLVPDGFVGACVTGFAFELHGTSDSAETFAFGEFLFGRRCAALGGERVSTDMGLSVGVVAGLVNKIADFSADRADEGR